MSGDSNDSWRNDLRGGLDGALQGLPTLVTPYLIFLGILGPLAVSASLWATLMCISLIPVVRLLLGGSGSLIAGPRAASVATYVALVLQMGMATPGSPVNDHAALLTQTQLGFGLAAASLMYLIASALVALSGFAKLGRVFKMIPNPVTAGISNGTAMLLLLLAFNKATEGGLPAGLTVLLMLLATFGWGWLQQNRKPYARWIPAIGVALLVGYAFNALMGMHLSGAPLGESYRLLAAPGWSFEWWKTLDRSQVHQLLMLGIPGTMTLALVMVLETFTAAGVMEVRFGVRTHADRELIASGCANMLGALLAGVPCTGSPAYSVSAWLSGGRGKWAAWSCIAVSTLIVVFSTPWLLALPAGMAAALLVLQAQVLVSPVFIQTALQVLRSGRWKKPGQQDLGFWITVIISLVGFFGNLIWACFAGVGLSCLAVLRRVSANLTARWVYLDAMRSRRIRSIAEADALSHLAQHVGILQLTGHLFFGNSGRITQLADELNQESQCVVIDFSQVQDADPSGLDAVDWLVQTLLKRDRRVVISGLNNNRLPHLQAVLRQKAQLVQCVDLDRGLEHCEEWILQNATKLPRTEQARPIEANGLLQGLTEDEITAVLMVVDVRQVARGEALFRKDEASDGVWMLKSGQVSIFGGGGELASRLATFGPGQFVGEMGFIDGSARSATVTADTAVEAVLLDRHAVAGLVREQPNAVIKITRNIARELAHRVRVASVVLSRKSEGPASSWENSALSVFNR